MERVLIPLILAACGTPTERPETPAPPAAEVPGPAPADTGSPSQPDTPDDRDCDPVDRDGDGWSPCDGDCDDSWRAVFPGAPVDCTDGVDTDCDGLPDCGFAGAMGVDRAVALVEGEHPGDALALLGEADDANGDGTTDLLLGRSPDAPESDIGCGAVYLVTTPRTGTDSVGGVSTVIEGTGQCIGSAAAAFDAGEDGVQDVLVGLEGDSEALTSPGGALLVRAPAGAMGTEDAVAALWGEGGPDRAGATVLVAPDLTGDGVVDVLVGAPKHAAGARNGGALYLTGLPLEGDLALAEADAKIVGTVFGQEAGTTAVVADMDGDGGRRAVPGCAGDPGDREHHRRAGAGTGVPLRRRALGHAAGGGRRRGLHGRSSPGRGRARAGRDPRRGRRRTGRPGGGGPGRG